MKINKKTYILLIFIVLIGLYFVKVNHSDISDSNAILLANRFISKLDIKTNKLPHISEEDSNKPFLFLPWLLHTFDKLFLTDKAKHIVVGEDNHELTIDVSCKDKEVVYFADWQAMEKVLRKYNIWGNKKPKWPRILTDKEANYLLLLYANKIGLPQDVVFSNTVLDLQSHGTWAGSWIRKLNGFPYEDDYIRIEVMAIDGEFFSYRKVFKGRSCTTIVKVSEEDAIAIGWEKITNYFDAKKWEQVKKEYEVKSAQLKIVQPNVFLGHVIPLWKSNKSRLAWVIEYDLRKETDSKQYDIKRAEFFYHDKFIIKIDALSGRFLGGVTSKYL
jgi:hypothetical protein